MGIGKESMVAKRSGSLPLKFEARAAQVGVVGLGYVGLPLALAFAEKGFPVTGFDVDEEKVNSLRQGQSYIRHIDTGRVRKATEGGSFRPTGNFAEMREMDAIIVCVPTPLGEHRDPDLSFVRNTAEAIARQLQPDQLIVLESTSYPGTTEEVVLPILEQSGLHCPVSPYAVDDGMIAPSQTLQADFLLGFSPEREDPGNTQFQTCQIPKIIGGVNAASALAAQALYQQVFERTVLVSSARAAEMTKLLENIYRCVNIALVNELKLLCLRMGIDMWEVIEAARTKPFGFTAFYPGPGIGGHCIPIDPFYLTWKAREYDFPTRFIELSGEVNSAMPFHVVESIADALSQRRQCLRDAKILVLGVAYKKDVDDLRESPSLRVIELLQARGAQVNYHDPYFPRLPKTRHYDFGLSAVELSPEALSIFDAVVITTDHSSYDYAFIVRHARLVIDARNATRHVKEHREKIVLC